VKARARRSPQGHAAGLAILTGGQAISEDLGIKPRRHARHARSRQKVKIDKKHHHRQRRWQKADIEARVNQIKRRRSRNHSDYDREKLQERLAKLEAASR